ncbi:MAG TPA: HAMP domain-containing sensor histidine kinase [Chloroflexota bacterium]|nr:HAMP domain-containing sensor histidine kinase [Chloroflexota bacterium]
MARQVSRVVNDPAATLVVSDQPGLASSVLVRLERSGFVPAHVAATAAQARRLVSDVSPAVVLLDGDLRGGLAPALLREMVASGCGPVVVAVGAERHDPASDLWAGAAGYLIKDGSFLDCVAAALVRALALRAAAAHTAALIKLGEIKKEFLARVSHELCTPLTYVLGYAELIANERVPPTEVPPLAEEIVRSARSLADLLDDLLDVARYERDGLRPTPALVNLSAVLDLAWLAVSSGGRRLEVDLQENPFLVWADPTLLGRALRYLLENTIRYSGSGSVVRVGARADRARVSIAVTDDGVGFDPAEAERLFEPLYRVETDLTHSLRGLGLGLAQVRAIALAHGGEVNAHSAGRGRGATFELVLPRRPAPEAATAAHG